MYWKELPFHDHELRYDQDSFNIIDNIDSISSATKNSYKNKIKYIFKNIKQLYNLNDLILEYKNVIDFLYHRFKNLSTLTPYISAIIKYVNILLPNFKNKNLCNHAIDQYTQCQKNSSIQIINTRIKNIEKPKNNTNPQNWNDVLNAYQNEYHLYFDKIMKKLDTSEIANNDYMYKKIRNFTLLSCYILNPPRRTNDYVDMLINQNNQKNNCINTHEWYFKFYNWKNCHSNYYDNEKPIQIHQKLIEILKIFIQIKKHYTLFQFQSNKNNNIISKIIIEFGNKYHLHLNIRELRHLFLTHYFKNNHKICRIQLANLSHQMGTSIMQMINTYKYDD